MLKFKSVVFLIIITFIFVEANAQNIDNNIQKLDSLASKLTQKNKIIKDVANYKVFPDNEENITDNGYLYTKMNGYQLPLDHSLVALLDEIFYSEDQYGIIVSNDKSIGYRKNGTDKSFKKGNLFREDSIINVNIYYAQKRKSKMETSVTKRFEIAEITILKRTSIPDVDESEDDGEGSSSRRTRSRAVKYIQFPRNMWYSLSGTNLQRALNGYDANLYNKILRLYDERTSDLDLSPFFPLPKRGPFLVSDSTGINTFTSYFTNTPVFVPSSPDEYMEIADVSGLDINRLDVTGFSALVNEKAGEDVPSIITLSNRSKKSILIDEMYFTTPNTVWKLANSVKEIEPDNYFDLEIVYNQSNSNTEDRNNLVIKWRELSDPVRSGTTTVPIAAKTAAQPPKVYFDISPLFLSGIVRFSNDWNFSFKLGDEEINYPYWSTGNFRLLAGYQNIVKFGVVLPANFTNGETFDIGSIVAPQRKLHGAFGLTAEFNLQPTIMKNINEAFAIGGYISYGKIKDGVSYKVKPLNINNDFFYTSFAMQVYYPLIFKDLQTNPKNIFQIKAGFSYHEIKRVHVFTKEDFDIIEYPYSIFPPLILIDGNNNIGKTFEVEKIKKIPSPYIKVDYMNLNTINQFGFGAMFVNNIIDFSGWLEITKWLRLEVSYIQALRDVEEWENSSFFWISPRIYF